jgi:hypothetical protein
MVGVEVGVDMDVGGMGVGDVLRLQAPNTATPPAPTAALINVLLSMLAPFTVQFLFLQGNEK